MKNINKLLLIPITLLALTSCGGETSKSEVITPDNLVTITYHINDKIYDEVDIVKGSVITDIPSPKDINIKVFQYWMDENDNKYNFDKPITADLDLYANFKRDDSKIQPVVKSQLSCHFRIENQTKVTTPQGDVLPVDSWGSGIVFDKVDDTYYVLTNCHVVLAHQLVYEQVQSLKDFDISVRDYNEKLHRCEVLNYDNTFDLALLKFTSKEEFMIPEFADKDPEIGDFCIAVGNPDEERNKITTGSILSYEQVKLYNPIEMTNVQFPTIKHNAWIDGGSSGGALLNDDLEICGINYAVNKSMGEYKWSHALPISKVKSYLNKYYY